MNTILAFKQMLSSYLKVPTAQWANLERCLKMRTLKANELYYTQGQDTDEIGFIVTGLVYNFYTSDKGDQFVKNFVTAGYPVASYMSVLTGMPANYGCKALEDTTLVTLKYPDLKRLYDEHPCWERMGRINAEQCFFETERREQQLLTLDATARYELFLKDHAELAGRAPQYLIASYIGVSPVTLSRIRGK